VATGLISICVIIVIAVTGEGVIIDVVKNAGLSGITGALLITALPGALLLRCLFGR